MAELTHGEGGEGDVGKRHHLIAHRVGIELTAHGILHPGVGHEDPPGGDGRTQAREPGGGEVEARRHLLPAEIHHGHEGTLHEEGDDTLDSQWRTEDVTHEPGIVRPVGAELELEDDTCGDTHGEVHAEQFLPELGSCLPELILRTIVIGLYDTHNDRQSEGQGHEEPVVDCRESELRPRPVDGSGINV